MNDIQNLSPPRRSGAIAPAEFLHSEERAGALKPVLVEYLHIFSRRKWWILAVFASALLLALIATLLTRPTYTAETEIEISREQKNVTNVAGVESEATGRNLEFYQTQYSLLEARSLAERVAKRLRLETNENFWAAHGIDAGELPGGAGSGATAAQRRNNERLRIVVDTLLDNVVISPTRGSSLAEINYSSYDPELSALIANAWANEFIAQSVSRKFESTAEARSYLERQLGVLRQRVETSERALVDFAASRNIVTVGNAEAGQSGTAQIRERTLAADSLTSLNSELARATSDRIQMATRIRIGGAVRSNETLSRLREQRAKDSAGYQQLMQQFDPQYPVALALARQIDELDRAIVNEERRIGREANEDFRSALQREQMIKTRVEQLSKEVIRQRRDAIQYNIFQREADANRTLYDGLLQRYKEIGVAGVAANNIAVIDRAEPPLIPSSPRLVLNLFLALILGIIGSLGLVFVLEQSQEGISDPSKIMAQFGLPLLGSVPKLPDDIDVMGAIRDPKSDVSESYLAIKSSLAFSTSHGIPRSFMVVSSQPAEGKSTTSLALSTSLARVGKRVILIDADMRKPSLHKHLGVSRDAGTSNYLAGDDDYRSLVLNIQPNLDFIPAGPSVPSAAELLSGDRMARFVALLEEQYDHVILDSAPIIGLADAPLLSRTVEAVVVVIESGRVPVRGISSALSRLRSAGAPIIGIVLTKLDKRESAYGYGYSYAYEYGASKSGAKMNPAEQDG